MTEHTKNIPKILIVDDRPENLTAMKIMLAELEAELVCAGSGNEALILILKNTFALCLLDLMMPDMDGFETAELMRKNKGTATLPIIFVTAMDDGGKNLFSGYECGAVDYLQKPIVSEILLAKVRVFLDLERGRQKLEDANRFIADQNKLLETRASQDGLTGIYNHAHFQELFSREFKLAQRHKHSLTVLMCDLDYFKDVNDTYGHQVGDIVLQEFATLLKEQVRDTDITARYGGEEFILALVETDLQGGVKVAEKIRSTLEKYIFRHGKVSLHATVSIGVATLGRESTHARELIELADYAMYKAKSGGRNQVVSCQDLQKCDDLQSGEVNFEQMHQELQKTLEKNKVAALASFEALVHSHLHDSSTLKDRNEKALRLVNLIGKRLHLPHEMMETFRRSFKLHDLFRLYVSDPVLASDTPLSKDDQQALYNQPLLMKKLTDLFDFFAAERQILLYHHEHVDGSGYPEGLAGDEVPVAARVFALVDAVVAMHMPSYPRVPISGDALINEVRRQSGSQFDPLLVELMVKVLEEEAWSDHQ
jgi:diguanylate cyclase (GGDEF)-like protein